MNRRQFCQLGLLSLPFLLSKGSQAAVLVSDEVVEAWHQSLNQLHRDFQKQEFPDFVMDLDENLRRVPDLATLQKQSRWIEEVWPKVSLTPSELPGELDARLEGFRQDLEFLKEWNALSQVHRTNPDEVMPSRGYNAMTREEQQKVQALYQGGADCVYITRQRWKGLVTLRQGGRWHDLYVRYWTRLAGADQCQPVQLANQALARCDEELGRLKSELKIQDLREYLARPELQISDEGELRAQLQELDRKVRSLKLFSLECPPVKFERMPNENPTWAPGMYRDGTFYYDINQTFHRPNLVWLYLHEALPGHHAQWCHQIKSTRPRLMQYPGMMEGWGVFAEHLGAEAGLMEDPVQRLGWILWDQVRSARVFLDWQIHRVGWSAGEAMQWWASTLPHHKDRGMTEVRRVVEWPGQSLSYKVGEWKLLALRQQRKMQLGASFNARDFHDQILSTQFGSWSELSQSF